MEDKQTRYPQITVHKVIGIKENNHRIKKKKKRLCKEPKEHMKLWNTGINFKKKKYCYIPSDFWLR